MSAQSRRGRLDARLGALSQASEGALVTFVTAGDPFPTVSETADVVVQLDKAGADIVELGIPFSDPLADGPSIQAASQRALDAGVTPPFVFDVVSKVRARSEVPLVLMTYYNPVLKYGLSRFADKMAQVGADGVILTDLPPEEADEWKTEADNCGISTIFLLAPTSTKQRIDEVTDRMRSGFVYCVSRTGVTGAKQDVPESLGLLVNSIKARTPLPVCVGFGVSSSEHVRAICSFADGAVVGSALVEFLVSHADNPGWKRSLDELVGEWKRGTLHSATPSNLGRS